MPTLGCKPWGSRPFNWPTKQRLSRPPTTPKSKLKSAANVLAQETSRVMHGLDDLRQAHDDQRLKDGFKLLHDRTEG